MEPLQCKRITRCRAWGDGFTGPSRFDLSGELGRDEIEERAAAGGRIDFEAGDGSFFDLDAATGSENPLDELGEIRFVADDGDALEVVESGELLERVFRGHAAGEPALEGRAGDAGGLAEFLGGLAGADQRAGEDDLGKLADGFQKLGGAAGLLAAFFDKRAREITVGVAVFGFSVAQENELHFYE